MIQLFTYLTDEQRRVFINIFGINDFQDLEGIQYSRFNIDLYDAVFTVIEDALKCHGT